MVNEEITIAGDVEDYEEHEDKEFSHQALIMRAMNRCLVAGAKEMRAGFIISKSDKYGNLISSYVDDTRKTFISSVNVLKMLMIPDFDKDAKENIKELLKQLKDFFDKLLKEELKDWEKLNLPIRKQRFMNNIVYREGCLHKDLPYYEEYVNKEVEMYQKILEELSLLTGRKDFFETQDYYE